MDVRGTVKTELRSTNSQGCRLEMSEYFADYETYLEGHIPGVPSSITHAHPQQAAVLSPSEICVASIYMCGKVCKEVLH